MIKNERFIFISSADWDNPYWTNQQHVASRLARDNRVLYVESLGLRRPVLQQKDLKRIVRRLIRFLRGPVRISQNLYTYSPFLIPLYKFGMVRKFNHWYLLRQLKTLISKLDLKDPVLWSYVPNIVELKGALGEKLTVYHCVDEIAANPLIPGEIVLSLEQRLLKEADLTLVSSRELYESKKEWAREIYYLPNVADIEHILKINDPAVKVPAEIVSLPHPVLGFIGAVSRYKLDFALLRQLAAEHPDWTLVLVGALGEGEKSADLEMLKMPNIHLLGGRPYSQLPNYLKGFDVCLLPNLLNEYTRHMFPLKFFEYLATGKPVVSTALRSLAEFREYFYQAATPGEFTEYVKLALAERPALKEKRIALSRKYSWTNRMEEISALLQRKLNPDAR